MTFAFDSQYIYIGFDKPHILIYNRSDLSLVPKEFNSILRIDSLATDGSVFYMFDSGQHKIYSFNKSDLFPVACISIIHKVLTPTGYKFAHEIEEGDYVLCDNKNVAQVMKKEIFCCEGDSNTNPFVIPKNYFELNYPKRDTLVSKNHLVLYNNEWFHPYYSNGFKQLNLNTVKYFHLHLDSYDKNIILDTGLVVESMTNTQEDFQIYKSRIKNNTRNYELLEKAKGLV